MKDNKENTTVIFSVDKETKKVYMESPDGRSDKKICLTDNYLWAVDEEKQTVDLVEKKSKRKQGYKYYSFLDIPEEYEKLCDNQLEKLFQ